MSREFDARETRFGRYLEDFEVGDVYRHWPGKTITEADDHLFCMITMNHHPLHTDAHYAETETQFGKNVVVGNLVYSLVLGMSVPDVSGKAIANLEVESLKHAEAHVPRRHDLRARRRWSTSSRRARSPIAAWSRSTPSAPTSAARSCASSGARCSCPSAPRLTAARWTLRSRSSGLTKRYGDHVAVDGVSFRVEQGEAFGILGPNGAGKTTTLEMIEGLRKPDAGEITRARPAGLARPAPRSSPGSACSSSRPSLFDMLTARELLELFAHFYLRPDGRERAQIALRLVGLESKADDYAERLSGGQQQRLAIALALVHDPEIVFLDEPTTGLDPQARLNLWDVIRSINAEQTQDGRPDHALPRGGRGAVRPGGDHGPGPHRRPRHARRPDRGSLNADARVSYTDGAGDHTVYVKDAQATVLEVLERARAGGDTVSNLSVKGADLEDVFMQLTGREYRE